MRVRGSIFSAVKYVTRILLRPEWLTQLFVYVIWQQRIYTYTVLLSLSTPDLRKMILAMVALEKL